jgi:hypothetical protein
MIFRIFRTLGTPTEEMWPNVSVLPDFQGTFPSWAPVPLSKKCPTLVSTNILLRMFELFTHFLLNTPFCLVRGGS